MMSESLRNRSPSEGFPQRLRELYRPGRMDLSIEIFPPKTTDGDASLHETLDRLTRYRPAFVSCTYGAGGSTQSRTVEWCRTIQSQYRSTATSHFTCVGATRDSLIQWLQDAHEAGIRNIMALRGDPPQGQSAFCAVQGGLSHANELVALIRERFPDMGIGVAAYPEKHLEAASPEVDLQNLKRKVEAGADAVFTQLFYDNETFLRFRENYQRIGLMAPLVPGIMPITEYARIQRITAMCGASVPAGLASRLEAVKDDKSAQFEIGVEHAIQQCQSLIAAGVPGIHLYVLNRSQAGERILDALGFQCHEAACV